MSTEIQNNLSTRMLVNHTQQNTKASEQSRGQAKPEQVSQEDTVSMTNQVTRLKEIETQLASYPEVDSARVSEIKQSLADGSYKIDAESIANKLIEIESNT